MLEKLMRESLLGAASGLVVWSIYFVAAYAWLSAACVAGTGQSETFDVTSVRLTLAVLTVITGVSVGYIGWRSWRAIPDKGACADPDEERHCFNAQLALAVAGLALVSTLWVGLPVLLVSPCS